MNAQQELLHNLKVLNTAVKCSKIKFYNFTIVLKINYSYTEFHSFLKELDFEYEAKSSNQKLFGTVWMEDGSWFERQEYGGFECWVHCTFPEIPKDCM